MWVDLGFFDFAASLICSAYVLLGVPDDAWQGIDFKGLV